MHSVLLSSYERIHFEGNHWHMKLKEKNDFPFLKNANNLQSWGDITFSFHRFQSCRKLYKQKVPGLNSFFCNQKHFHYI